MTMRNISLILIYLVFLLFLAGTTQVNALSVESVASKMVCLCGTCSNLPMNTCTCDVAAKERAEIGRMIGQGKTEDQIIKYFVNKHGERVLAVLPASGFNLTAWVMPFFALGIGCVIVYLVVTKWFVRQREELQSVERPELSSKIDSAYRDRIQRDLKNLD